MKKLLSSALFMAVMLLLSAGWNLSAQTPKFPSSVGVSVYGGPAWSFGGFRNIGSDGLNVIQPQAGISVSLGIGERFRSGLDVSFTRMIREQVDASLQPLTGDGIISGSTEGTLYKDFMTRFFSAGLSAGYSLLKAGPLELFIETGAGCIYAAGNTWSLSVRNELRSDTLTSTVSVTGHNDPHEYLAPYIPAGLSLEIGILPQTRLCAGARYRYIITGETIAPKHQACATLGLMLVF